MNSNNFNIPVHLEPCLKTTCLHNQMIWCKGAGEEWIPFMTTHYVKCVYVMVNRSWSHDHLVKIGYTDNLHNRINALSGTSMPFRSKCYAMYAVENKLDDKRVHKKLANLRHSDDREFFIMTPAEALNELRKIAKADGHPERVIFNPCDEDFSLENFV